MDDGRTQLRNRMLRDAIVEVLKETFGASGDRGAISLVDTGFIRQITVAGDRVRVELALSAKWSPFAGSLGSAVQRRVQALPEVMLTEVSVSAGEERTATGLTPSTCQ